MKNLLFFVLLFFQLTTVHAQKDSSIIVFKNVNVIDGVSKKALKKVHVIVSNGKITGIQRGSIKPTIEGIIIELSGKWLLPGYIDAHTHLYTVDAVQTALSNGVTTARTMGCNHFFDIEIRNKHAQKNNSFPDIIAAGYQIGPDMPEEFYKDFPEFTNLKPTVQGVENVRRIVKALVAHKVDFIKILATERAGTPDTDPRNRTFTDEEIVAIVDEANKAGIPVAAHAHGDEGAYAAVRAGVRSIEHGSYLSYKTLAVMKLRGTYLVPTFSFWEQTAATPQNKDNPVLTERIKTFVQLVHGVTSLAYKMGVPVVAGTDTRYVVSGLSMESEAVQLKKAGMSAMDIIKAMTHLSAQCLRIDARTGTVKKDMEADLVVLEQNPLSDITALKKIVMVVNDGKVVINRLQ